MARYKFHLTIQFRESGAGDSQLSDYYDFISKHKARRLKGGREEGVSRLVFDSNSPLTSGEISQELGCIPLVKFEQGER